MFSLSLVSHVNLSDPSRRPVVLLGTLMVLFPKAVPLFSPFLFSVQDKYLPGDCLSLAH